MNVGDTILLNNCINFFKCDNGLEVMETALVLRRHS